jgi:regulator of protease activity HflC (stomatin/prohibitin superfamily)
MDDVLTTGREAIEHKVRAELQSRLDRYQAGIQVLRVKLQDVHPSLEVVDAFREVSGAFEEKAADQRERGISQRAGGARRGNAQARVRNAEAYTLGRRNRSAGDASRFIQQEAAFRAAPGPNETRLYLETLEQVLPGKRKLIVDPGKGRRQITLLEDGVEIAPPAVPIVAPQRPPREEE